ncbi:MAG: hypothetical protein ACYDCL_06510 [Myxococcales bacterium]
MVPDQSHHAAILKSVRIRLRVLLAFCGGWSVGMLAENARDVSRLGWCRSTVINAVFNLFGAIVLPLVAMSTRIRPSVREELGNGD